MCFFHETLEIVTKSWDTSRVRCLAAARHPQIMEIPNPPPLTRRGTTEVMVALNCLYTKGGGARACWVTEISGVGDVNEGQLMTIHVWWLILGQQPAPKRMMLRNHHEWGDHKE